MPINFRALKADAQRLIMTSKPKPFYAGLIMLALGLIMGLLSANVAGLRASQNELARYLQYLEDGNVDYALQMLESFMPPVSGFVIDIAIRAAYSIVSVGFIIFMLNTIRNAGACYGNLLDGFGFFLRILWLNILEGIFIGLWSLLLIVPGIVASYRYRMAVYLLIDHPDMSAMDCIRESKRMMAYRKGELFGLDLSFIGWYILASIPFLSYLVQAWSIPYIEMSRALYYEALLHEQQKTAGSYSNPNTPPPWEG